MAFTLITFVFFTVLVAVISYVKTKGDDQTTSTGTFWRAAAYRVWLLPVRCC